MLGDAWLESTELEDPKAVERLCQLAMKTASKVGDEFFAEVVLTLAEILEVSQMVITECFQLPPQRVRTLAFCSKNSLHENFEYDLKGTPCEVVYDQGIYFCSKNVQESHPTDYDLVALQTKSYGGISLTDSKGVIVGHLCYLDEKEIEDSTWQIAPMKLLRARCGAEIERMHLERIRTEQQEVVEQSKRLASLGTLAAGIAHEINNPLTTIQLLVEFGLDKSQIDKVMPQQNLELMMGSVKSISQIVEGVLRAASDQDTKKTICDLTGILRKACDLTSHISETTQIKVALGVAETCFITGNPLELQQVFVNLISNAIQATANSDQNEDVEISIAKESKYYCVSISNQGLKIPEQEQCRIFEPFYTSRHSQGGTGLGLSVSLGIIKAHGGDISVQSNSEVTRFVVRIPSSNGGANENRDS